MPLSITLENNSSNQPRTESFQLPTSPEDLRGHLDSVGFTQQIIDEVSMTAALADSNGLAVTDMDNPETILQMDELNYLATLYDVLDDAGKIKFKAVLEYIGRGFSQFPHELGNIGDTIDIILNLDKYTFYPGIDNLHDLGVRIFNDLLARETEDMAEYRPANPPYKAHAEANIRNYGGCFTSDGYVAGRGEGFVPHFMLGGVPEEYRIWEKAFAELPAFENPIKIDYEEISEGHTGIASLLLGHEVFDFLCYESNIPTYAEIAADNHTARARQMIELAGLVQVQDQGLITLIKEVARDSSLEQFPYELIDRINDPDDELDIQLHLERSYGIDDEYEENYREELMKLPPDLQFDEHIKAMMENRKRHQQTADGLEKLQPPLSQLTPEEQKRFDMLPADKQARLVGEQDTYMQYCGLLLDNARSMADLYSRRITEYQQEHMKNGPYNRKLIERATVLKSQIDEMAGKEYTCDPNVIPVVTIETHGCALFPLGSQYPFPVFHEMFSKAVEYHGLLHEAGVPLSQNMVYLAIDFVMEGERQAIKPNTEKAALLFLDQGKSFLEQIVSSDNLQPGYREKLAAYLTMHLGVDANFRNEVQSIPARYMEYYQDKLEQGFDNPLGGLSTLPTQPDFYAEAMNSAKEMCQRINMEKDYSNRLITAPSYSIDADAVAQRFAKLLGTLDPCGPATQERFHAFNVAENIITGNTEETNKYIRMMYSIDGIYEGAGINTANWLEETVAAYQHERHEPAIENGKPSIHDTLRHFRQEAEGIKAPPKDTTKSEPQR